MRALCALLSLGIGSGIVQTKIRYQYRPKRETARRPKQNMYGAAGLKKDRVPPLTCMLSEEAGGFSFKGILQKCP